MVCHDDPTIQNNVFVDCGTMCKHEVIYSIYQGIKLTHINTNDKSSYRNDLWL